ncbi:hypothetical protein SDC9_167548 [bioreactor metagenome]|uniref:Uncharacterized protein n=1 Tax=bioreactor metagenome TaxID=1076179 RepID=A0A645G034_9ZZZZ
MVADIRSVAAGSNHMRFVFREDQMIQSFDDPIVGGCGKAENLFDRKKGDQGTEGG